MRADVAQRARAVLVDATPVERHNLRGIRAVFGDIQPLVPVEGRRNGLGRPLSVALRGKPATADGSGRPHNDLANLADKPRGNPFLGDAQAVAGVNHVAHLRGKTLLFGERGKLANLADIMAEGLFKINREAAFKGEHRGGKVPVVGRRDYDGVHLALHFFEHFAVVYKASRVGVGVFLGVAEAVRASVDVAVGDELLLQALHDFHVRAAHKPAADKPDSYRVLLVRFKRLGLLVRLRAERQIRSGHRRRARASNVAQEFSSRFIFHI